MAKSQVAQLPSVVQSKKPKTLTIHDLMLNGAVLSFGGSWTDRWLDKNTIERTGAFDIEGDPNFTAVEMTATIRLGRLLGHRRAPKVHRAG